MRRTLLIVLLLAIGASSQTPPPFTPSIPPLSTESSQVVPASVLRATKAVVAVDWPGGSLAGIKDVQNETESFIRKWNRFQLVPRLEDADVAILVYVQPVTREAGFGSRALWNWEHADNAVSAPPPDQRVLTGVILVYNPKEMLAPGSSEPKPLLFAISDTHGNKPLLTAGKKLRKMIDAAAKEPAKP